MPTKIKAKERLLKIKQDPRIRRLRNHVSCIWILAAFFAAIGLLLLLIGAGTENWLKYDNVTFKLAQDTTSIPADYIYNNIHSGIYLFSMKTSRMTLQQQALSICTGYESVASRQNTMPITINGESCDQNCVSHFQIRCVTFKALTNAGFVNLAFLISGAALSLTGIVWLMVFGKARQFLTLAWAGSGAACCFSLGYWIFVVWNNRVALESTSFYPTWHMGESIWIGLAGSCLCIFAGLIAFLAGQWDAHAERNLKREAILTKEIEEGGLELPEDMQQNPMFPAGIQGLKVSLGSPPALPQGFGASRASQYGRMSLPTPGQFVGGAKFKL